MPQVLKLRDFRILFLGRVLFAMALQAQAVIVGWHVYELSHDPLMLGLIGLAEAIPAIGFAFLAGHVVDNRKPFSVYKISTLVLVLNTILIWSTTVLPFSADLLLLLLFTGVFVSGASRSFTSPAVFSLVSHVVPRSMMAEASAFNSGAFQVATIFGPALGGILYGTCGPRIAFALPPLLMVAVLAVQTLFSQATKNMQSVSTREPFLTSILSGIRFAYQQKVLLSALALDMFSVLFGGAVAILPMFSDQILHAGSVGLGFLRAAPSVGSAIIALFLAVRPMRTISGRMLLFVVAGFGLATIGFALSTQFALAFFFLALSGVFDGVSMVIRNTVLQLLTPNHMRGRISSLSSIFITSSNEIGAFESGVAAKLLGLVPSIVFGGVMTLVVVGTTAGISPELRKTRIRPADEK